MKKVFIVGGGVAYAKMLYNAGFHVVLDIDEADFVQFTGGSDVSPHLYGEGEHPTTHSHELRDADEVAKFNACIARGIPMAGICRGAQFLNVMCGGKLFQDVSGHANGNTHTAYDVASGREIQVTSTHHQMIRLHEDGKLLMHAKNLSSRREYCDADGRVINYNGDVVDVEAAFYARQKVICFQPHPEMHNCPAECTAQYLQYLDEYLLA